MPDPPGKTGIESSSEFVKYTTAFGTGALVFSVGLVGDKVILTAWAKGFLIASWTLLLISIVAGVLAYSRIPVMLSNKNYNLRDPYFEYPGICHQIAFLFGIAFLAIALVIILTIPSFNLTTYKILSAQQAIDFVKTSLPEDKSNLKISKVELIHGVEESGQKLPVWYVQLEEVSQSNDKKNIPLDFFVDAKTGTVSKFRE